jgi:hypothetical protein
MYFFDKLDQKYLDMEIILKRMKFYQKLEILKLLKLIDGDIYNDLRLISFCRNKFVHPPIIESVNELLSLDSIKDKEFRLVKKKISQIKNRKEFMEIYEKVCRIINKIFEEREVKWIQKLTKEMYTRLPEEAKRKLPFTFL